MASEPPAIDVRCVSRTFGRGAAAVAALQDVSFALAAGECVALLGVNGAGKTTLARILGTLLSPTSGTAAICGIDVATGAAEARRRMAVVLGGERGLYGPLSARENLEYFAAIAGVPRRTVTARVTSLLEEVGLVEAGSRAVETYSRGMKQRLHIAAGMVGHPAVLLLDEPTVGLDPMEAERLRGHIASLVERGITVLLTSHYLLDVERLASRVLLLDHGRLVTDLPIRQFAAVAGYEAAVEVQLRGNVDEGRLREALGGLVLASMAMAGEGGDVLATVLVPAWRPDVLTALGKALGELPVEAMRVRSAGLEEAFAVLARRGARSATAA